MNGPSANGAYGANGAHSENGVDGVDGVDGGNGANGAQGENGFYGENGLNGENGFDGENGLDGRNGADGDVTNGLDGANSVDAVDAGNGLGGGNGFGDVVEMMDFLDEGEDLAFAASSQAEEVFDEIIGHIEDIVMDDDFQTLQNDFLERYYSEFEDTEENKFVYTDIHRDYVQCLEQFMEQELVRRVPGFAMDAFLVELATQKSELEGEIFEMLVTFTDFSAFKEMMVDYKNEKEGRTIDLSAGLCITPLSR